MMTQADVLSESMKNDEEKPSVATNEATQQNEVTLNAPDLLPNAVGYKYDQDSMNGEIQLGNLNTNPAAKTENTPIQPLKYFAKDSAINSSKGLRNIIIGGMTFSGIITIALIIQIAIGTTQVPYRIGIVTQEKVCSDMGADIVHKGGKSIDAFIVSSLCLSVVNPFASGPGAGGFLLIRDHKHDQNVALNCHFKSSEDLESSDYESNPVTGKKSIGVPGEYKCIKEVYKYARFNWRKLTEPVIKLANEGFRVSRTLSDNLKKLDIEKDIKENPYMSEIFLRDDQIVRENDIITNKRLAKTIERLRDNDNDLYDGGVADSIVDDSELSHKDMRNYYAKNEDMSKTKYNDFIVLTAAYPSNGPVFRYVLELMETLKLTVEDFKNSEFYHRLLQANEMGYEMSAYTADPSDTTLLTIYQQALRDSKKYFKAFIDGNVSTVKSPLADFKLDTYHLTDDLVTNFISVNDHNDLMISYTGTLGSAWGSRIMTKDGFMLNNALNFFTYGSSNSNENNGIAPSKQPRALFTPILAYNEKNPCVRRFSVSYSHKALSNNDFGMTELTSVLLKLFTDYSMYETAVADKRIQYHYQGMSCFEDGFDNNIRSEILGKNLFTQTNNCSYHGIDLIMKKDHIIYSKVDNRSISYDVVFNK